MDLDLKTDAKRIYLAFLFSGVFFLATLGLVFYQGLYPSWIRWQQSYQTSMADINQPIPGIIQINLCSGEIDRCTTCHLGIHRRYTSQIEAPGVFRSHPDNPYTGSRAHQKRGCTACHGGSGRALVRHHAHAIEGQPSRDPLMDVPYTQAGCVHCHLPGQQPGQQRLARGALIFLRLGCLMCHPLKDDGLGGFDYGPNLRQTPRKSVAYLENSLIDPTANFSKSTMPSFAATFSHQKESLTDLIIFLISLSLDPYPSACTQKNNPAIAVDTICTSCHAGSSGKASGRFQHRCLYLIQRSLELKCSRCHEDSMPSPNQAKSSCPLVERHKPNCQVCHQSR